MSCSRYTGMAARLKRAQANLMETLPIFIGAVLLAWVAGRYSSLTGWGGRNLFSGKGAVCACLCLWMGAGTQSDLGCFYRGAAAGDYQSAVKDASVMDGGATSSRMIHRATRAEMTR